MITDTHCNPVVAAAGFAETELTDDQHVYMAVHFLRQDKIIAEWERTISETLDNDARLKHAGSEPPLTMGMPDEAFVAAIEWLEKLSAARTLYDSLIMALQMLQPREKAAVRERVLAKIKAAEVVQ